MAVDDTKITNNFTALLEKVDEEFIKSLQCIHPTILVTAAKVALRIVELVYYKPQKVYNAMRMKLSEKGQESESGLITGARRILSKLYSCGGSVKDLLAQEVSQSWKTSQQVHIERGGQIPYHMHINLELLEAIHQTCWLLTDHHPGNVGDHAVMAATRALSQGEFDKSYDVINSLDVSRPLRNHEKVTDMLKDKIKEEASRTYLTTYSSCYGCPKLDQLSKTFIFGIIKPIA
nr:eukaryotic translation initiation factor 3 subunit C-like [Tanacetum cinerariifolium]